MGDHHLLQCDSRGSAFAEVRDADEIDGAKLSRTVESPLHGVGIQITYNEDIAIASSVLEKTPYRITQRAVLIRFANIGREM
jgi:hypothetical protein